MGMVDKQARFTWMIALLVIHAKHLGYQLTYGDAYRDPRVIFPYSHENSNHKRRLAVDFNLFKEGKYLTKDEDYAPLRKYWVSIGGADGIDNDANHFSVEYGGII